MGCGASLLKGLAMRRRDPGRRKYGRSGGRKRVHPSACRTMSHESMTADSYSKRRQVGIKLGFYVAKTWVQ